MDPHANLRQQRESARAIIRLDDSIGDPSELHGIVELREYDERRSAIEEEIVMEARGLAELVIALDEWRLSGGFDPYTKTEATE